jgi:hypothetical protein
MATKTIIVTVSTGAVYGVRIGTSGLQMLLKIARYENEMIRKAVILLCMEKWDVFLT